MTVDARLRFTSHGQRILALQETASAAPGPRKTWADNVTRCALGASARPRWQVQDPADCTTLLSAFPPLPVSQRQLSRAFSAGCGAPLSLQLHHAPRLLHRTHPRHGRTLNHPSPCCAHLLRHQPVAATLNILMRLLRLPCPPLPPRRRTARTLMNLSRRWFLPPLRQRRQRENKLILFSLRPAFPLTLLEWHRHHTSTLFSPRGLVCT